MSFRLKYEGDEINERLDKAGTALQEHQDISHLATKDELSDGLDKKQDVIEDLESIRENASKGATALQSVPSEYVTESELDEKGFLTEIPDEYVTEEELEGKGYLTEHQSLAHLATKSELEGKVDKVVGKQLSTEDFTTLLKEKLESLKNYDDAELVSRIDAIQETIDTLFSKDASSAIESFNEIIAFLEGIEDSQSLDSIIASIEQQIADVAKAIPTKVSELENDKGYLTEHQDVSQLATRGELESGLATKQDTISDLDTIRSGAAKGATALQSIPSGYNPTLDVLKAVYPVGSIYMSMIETNPSSLFGFGTWEQVKGRFLVGAANTLKAGDIGGEASVTLTKEQIPAHTHTRGTMEIYGALTERPCSSSAEILNSKANGAFKSTMSGDDLQWGVTVQTSGQSNHKNNLHEFIASRNWTGETSSVGGGIAHNNLPPYLVVYIWKRTA